MNIREFSNLIDKYKQGKCSLQEKELLETYLKSFQKDPGEWNENEMGNQRIIDAKIYSEIMKKIRKEKVHYPGEIFFSTSLLKRAASIIFLIIIASGILYISGIFRQKAPSIVWNEIATSRGEKSTISLSDGSRITLNADSKLKYPQQFYGKYREVYLKGEAYFEIHHNSAQRFIVRSESLSTIDLGTKFDVSAYPGNKTITVSLLEGKVRVSRDKVGGTDEIVVLKPKEQLLYNKEKNVGSLERFDSLEVVGWKDNIYKFENEPLGEVLSLLERSFDVKFTFKDKSVLAQKITIKFERNSIKTIADVIKSLTGIDYKIDKADHYNEEFVFGKTR